MNSGGGNNGTQARFDALQEQLNTIQGQNALMSAITGGTSEIKALASTLNCDINAVQGAINAVQSAICNLQNSGNMNAQSIITAVNSGDQGIIRQICDCCCGVKQLITEQGYQNQLANLNQTNTLTGAINNVAIEMTRHCPAATSSANGLRSVTQRASLWSGMTYYDTAGDISSQGGLEGHGILRRNTPKRGGDNAVA